jgi:hypothetical protein
LFFEKYNGDVSIIEINAKESRGISGVMRTCCLDKCIQEIRIDDDDERGKVVMDGTRNVKPAWNNPHYFVHGT